MALPDRGGTRGEETSILPRAQFWRAPQHQCWLQPAQILSVCSLGGCCAVGICLVVTQPCGAAPGCVRNPCPGGFAEGIIGKAGKRRQRQTAPIPPEPRAQIRWFTPGTKILARLRGDFRSESQPRGLTPRLSISSRKFTFLRLRTKFLLKATASCGCASCWL